MMIGDRIYALRVAKGWSQGQLALRSGVSREMISKLERGVQLGTSLSNAIKFAKALNVPVESLTGKGR